MPSALNKLSRKALFAVPARVDWSTPVECDSLILLPLGTRLHESGYRLMDAVACDGDDPLCRVSGCSDVFHIEAPSNIWTKDRTPSSRYLTWYIDCLARSGLFRIFAQGLRIQVGAAISDLSLHPITIIPETPS